MNVVFPSKCLYFFLILFLLPILTFSETAGVKNVIDGDTFHSYDGRKVRMLGINATEREEWFYQEAKDYLSQLIKGKEVTLIRDSKSPDKDKYGRLLRYVQLEGLDINKEMISKGYTYAFLRYPIDRKSAYGSAEREAKRLKLGLWSGSGDSAFDQPEHQDDTAKYTVYGILIFIVVVILIQTWRYFK